MQQVNPAQQARRIEVSEIRTAIEKAIPVDVEVTSILLALADLTRSYTSLLIRLLEETPDKTQVPEEPD